LPLNEIWRGVEAEEGGRTINQMDLSKGTLSFIESLLWEQKVEEGGKCLKKLQGEAFNCRRGGFTGLKKRPIP